MAKPQSLPQAATANMSSTAAEHFGDLFPGDQPHTEHEHPAATLPEVATDHMSQTAQEHSMLFQDGLL